MQIVTNVTGWVICVFIGLIGAVILWRMIDGTINLSRLISEPNGDASMSRLQLLVFTFVVALCLFLLVLAIIDCHSCTLTAAQAAAQTATQTPPLNFPEIPGSVLALLGISAGSYVVSKGIQFSNPAGVQERGSQLKISPMNPTVPLGQSQAFSATTAGLPSSRVSWSVVAGLGAIDSNGLYTAPARADTLKPPLYATVKAQSVGDATQVDLAVVTLV